MLVSDSFQSSTLPVGFTYLDLDDITDIRVYCNTFDDNGTVQLNLSTWGNTILHSAQSNWLDVLAINSTGFQWGSFSTQDVDSVIPVGTATRQVVFRTPFNAPPVVIAWINELEISSTLFGPDLHSWRITTSISNVAADQFTMGINTWSSTYLYSAAASWIAYPSNSSEFASGGFSTFDLRPWEDVQLLNQKHISFDKPFQGTPLVTAALNELDFGTAANLRISLNITDVSSTGLTWHLDSWADSIFYSGSGSYLAWYYNTTTATQTIHPIMYSTVYSTVYPTTHPAIHPSYATIIGISLPCSVLATLAVVFVVVLIFRRRRRLKTDAASVGQNQFLEPGGAIPWLSGPSMSFSHETPSSLVYNTSTPLVAGSPSPLSPNTPFRLTPNMPTPPLPHTSNMTPLISHRSPSGVSPSERPLPPVPSPTHAGSSSSHAAQPISPVQVHAVRDEQNVFDDAELGMEANGTTSIAQIQPPPYTLH